MVAVPSARFRVARAPKDDGVAVIDEDSEK
jgi:hypothetical protein